MKNTILLLIIFCIACTKQFTDLAPPVQFDPEQNSGMGDPCLTNDCGNTVSIGGYRDEVSGCEYSYRVGKSWNQSWLNGPFIYYYSLSMKCDNGGNYTARWSKYGFMRKAEVKEEAHKRLPITVEFADELIEKVQPEELTETP